MKCACCGQDSDILICLDPFTLPERPRLSNQPATYCCEYCGSIIIRELMQHRKEAKNKHFDISRSVKKHKAVVIGVGVVTTLVGVGAYTYHTWKVHKKAAVEESFADFQKSLTEYLKASKNGELNAEVVDNILNALDVLENKEFEGNMRLMISSSQLTALISIIFAYTELLAKANSFDAKILKPQSDMKGKIESLKSYLKIQKQILQSAA